MAKLAGSNELYLLPGWIKGVANGIFKIVGFEKFWPGLEISAVFVLSLEVSFGTGGAFSVSGVADFFTARLRNLGYLYQPSRNLEILAD